MSRAEKASGAFSNNAGRASKPDSIGLPLDAVFAFGVRIVGAAATLAGQILTARWLGLVEYGVYSHAWVWIVILGTITQLGLATTSVRFACAYRFQARAATLKGLVLFAHGATLIASIIGVLIYLLISHLTRATEPAILLFASLCIPLFCQIEIGRGLSRVGGSAWGAYFPGMLLRPCLVFCLTVAALLTGLAGTPQLALLIMVAGFVCAWIVQIGIIKMRIGPLIRGTQPKWQVRAWSSPAPGVMAADLFALFAASIDILLVYLLLSPAEGGRYFAAAKAATLVSFIAFAVCATAQSRFAELVAADQRDLLGENLRRFTLLSALPTIVGSCLIIGFGEQILSLFGGDYVSAHPELAIITIGYAALSFGAPARVLLIMAGRQNAVAVLLTSIGVACAALNVLLITAFGTIGAALAFAGTSVAASAGLLILVALKTGTSVLPSSEKRKVIAGLRGQDTIVEASS